MTSISRKALLQNIIVAAAFINGFVIMTIELLGGRVLSPYFGTSVYVWGSIITIFMLSLSLGYLCGGRLSGRRHAPRGGHPGGMGPGGHLRGERGAPQNDRDGAAEEESHALIWGRRPVPDTPADGSDISYVLRDHPLPMGVVRHGW